MKSRLSNSHVVVPSFRESSIFFIKKTLTVFDVYDISSFALNFMAPVRHPKKTALNSRHRADNEKWKTIFCCGWEQKILSERWSSGVCEKRRSFKLRQSLWQKIVNLSGRNCSLQDLFPIIIVILRHFSPLTRFWFFVSAHFPLHNVDMLCFARQKRQFDSCLFPHSCTMIHSIAKQFHFSFDLPCSLEKTWWKIGEKEES